MVKNTIKSSAKIALNDILRIVCLHQPPLFFLKKKAKFPLKIWSYIFFWQEMFLICSQMRLVKDCWILSYPNQRSKL